MPCKRGLVLVGKYAPRDVCFEEPGREAREAKIWLWTDPQPVPGWKWRREKKKA
jgi:hypothetical protein